MTTRSRAQRLAAEALVPQGVIKTKEEIPEEPFLEEPIRILLSQRNSLNAHANADFDVHDFPDGTDDIPLAKKRVHNPQDWKKVDEIFEFHKVYMYGLLENNELFVSYFTKEGEYTYKCAEDSCEARLKIEVHEVKKDQGPEGKSSKAFTSEMLKKSFDLQVPKLTIYRSYKHDNHKEDYKNKCLKRLKGSYFVGKKNLYS